MSEGLYRGSIAQYTPRQLSDLSGLAREAWELTESRNEAGLTIAADTIDRLLASAPRPFDIPTKARKILRYIAENSPSAGETVEINDRVDRSIGYAIDGGEFYYLIRYAVQQNWISWSDVSYQGDTIHQCTVLPAGWEQTERKPREESEKAFVAMWFAEAMNEPYELGIKEAIQTDCGYRAIRIDTEHYNGDIVDRVLAEINESRFVVADLTGHRNGVYFEAGYAMGLGLEVIWTCREDAGRGTHFDAEHFNQIRWNDPADLREKLQARIRATIGKGPLVGQ